MEQIELTKLKLQNLFLLRTFMSQVLIVLTGGIVGLFFAEKSIAQITFIAIGSCLDIFVFKCFIGISLNIKKILLTKELNNDRR